MIRKKKVIIIVSILLALIITSLVFFVIIPGQELEKVRNMTIHDVDLSALEDGMYQGEYAYGHSTYLAEVEVKEHRIADIDVSYNRSSKHAKAAEGVIDNIISEQKINVDVISGATTTSKAILKAVENALTQ